MAIMLVDVDSMFASCEQVLNPQLKNKPVVVLSNNDGCVIAATTEVKKLGLKLGTPWFQVKRNPKFKQVIPCSNNHQVYGEFSQRMMKLLRENYENVEPYSIDEAFIELPDYFHHTREAINLRKLIKAELGLPVSIGIAKTKTLAKLATHIAKNETTSQHVYNIRHYPLSEIHQLLAKVEVNQVWGIGRRLFPKLQANRILTALELAQTDPLWARHKFSTLLEQTVRELNNQICLPVQAKRADRHKSILYSRLLSRATESRAEIEQIVTLFVAKLAEKLNIYQRFTKNITVALSTSRFISKPVTHKKTLNFSVATNDPVILIKFSKKLLAEIYTPYTPYNRVLILCKDLTPESPNPLTIEKLPDPKLTETVYKLQQKYGFQKINYGTNGLPELTAWSTKHNYHHD